jgi:hypothetical protein
LINPYSPEAEFPKFAGAGSGIVSGSEAWKMVHSLAAQYPFTNGEGLVLYHPSSMESFFPVAPGIEVSIEPCGSTPAKEGSHDFSIYNHRGKIIPVKEKGRFVDSVL